ncbi:hypothetical protein B0T20DRAFT_9910 [Sordaria brevicollis]|uniref:Uncharacterized protein n=1 Tax=Sordaria brevicollis TaxID=83679 RepID=A0AAE0UG77_SORBR|nr:hypothetical protein B0T20DRAFT_9910 [Sordaria brevicollis]
MTGRPLERDGIPLTIGKIWGILKKPFLVSFDLVCSGFGLFGLYIIIFIGGLCPVACRSMNFSFFSLFNFASSLLCLVVILIS